MFHSPTLGRFLRLPRLLCCTLCSSAVPSPSMVYIWSGSLEPVTRYSKVPVERLRHVWISGLIDPDKIGPKERSLLYSGQIEDMHASLNEEQQQLVQNVDLNPNHVRAGITFLNWKDHKISVLDTLGNVDDFTNEVETAMGAFDSGAIHVLSCIDGVQSQSITIDEQMIRYKLPRLIFIDNLDHKGANPWQVLNQVRSKLHRRSAAIQVPIGLEDDFKGLVDLVQLKAYYFHGSNGEKVVVEEVPANMEALVAEKRRELIENVAPLDDKLAEAFCMKTPISATDLEEAVRRAIITRRFIPIFMGSAFKYKGLQLLLDGVVNYLPCPTIASNYALDESKNGEKEHTLLASAFSLKKKWGKIRYLRVNEGVMKRGHILVDDNTGKRFEVGRLYHRRNGQKEMIPVAHAGEIVTAHEYCIDDDEYRRRYSSIGDTYLTDGLVRYSIVGIARYPYEFPVEDPGPPRVTLKDMLEPRSLDDICPGSVFCDVKIFNKEKVINSTC